MYGPLKFPGHKKVNTSIINEDMIAIFGQNLQNFQGWLTHFKEIRLRSGMFSMSVANGLPHIGKRRQSSNGNVWRSDLGQSVHDALVPFI